MSDGTFTRLSHPRLPSTRRPPLPPAVSVWMTLAWVVFLLWSPQAFAAPRPPEPQASPHPDATADTARHTVTLLIPFSADGPTDRVGRDVAIALRRSLGQPVRVENYSGEGGILGSEKVAKSSPDGRILLITHVNMATAANLYPQLPYTPATDFEPLGLINEVPMVIVARPNLPAKTAADFVRWLRTHADTALMAHAGLGSASHLCGMLLQAALGINVRTVSFRGARPATPDLIDGHVDFMCDQTTDTLEHIQAGRLQAYAVTPAQRLHGPLAHLPTLTEAGLPGVQLTVWHGLYAPKNTPPPLIDRLNTALQATLDDPEFRQRQLAWGATVVDDKRRTPEGHRAFVASETRRFAPLIDRARTYIH